MKFDDKYPEATNAQKLNPEKLMGPHREVEVTSEIFQSWRVFPCLGCGSLTGWRYSLQNQTYPAAPACSDECVALLKANNAEVAADQPESLIPSEVPPSEDAA